MESSAAGAGAALQTLQWSQTYAGAGTAGDGSAGALVALWQIAENGSADALAAIGMTMAHKIACRTIT